jgi:hypothetical protein
MPDVVTVLMCTGSAVDSETNNYTLYNLIERAQIPVSVLSAAPRELNTPFEGLAWIRFAEEERDRPHEIRFEWLDANGDTAVAMSPFPLASPSETHRVRQRGLAIPTNVGEYVLTACTRPQGGEWTRGDARWAFALKT